MKLGHGVGLWLMEKVSPFKHHIAEFGMGIRYPVPTLLRGRNQYTFELQLMNDLKHDILIGAGIVGLTSAISLHLKGFSVGIITNRPVNQKSSKVSPVVYALNRPSEGFLKKLKLWDNLEAKDYDHVLIWDSFHKEEVLFSGTDCAEPNLGHIVEDQKLMLSCLKVLSNTKYQFTLMKHCQLLRI